MEYIPKLEDYFDKHMLPEIIDPVYKPTVFMLIEHMIQLSQETSIPGVVCILLERRPLPVIIFYESN